MTLAAFLAFALLTLLGAISPGSAVLMSARTGLNEGFRTGAFLAVLFTFEAAWNILVARIFSLDRTRATYISLKTIIDRAFGGMLVLLGVKIAAT